MSQCLASHKTIEEQKVTIQEREETIAKQEVTIEDQKETIVEQEETIGKQEITIEDQKETIIEQDQTITEQKETIIQRDKTITEQVEVILEQEATIEEQVEKIKVLTDALGSSFTFKTKGFKDKVTEVKPEIYMGRDWSDDWNLINKNGEPYHPRHAGNAQWTKGDPVGLRGYNYWKYYYTLEVSSKNLVYRVSYDENYEDWSGTSSPELRTTFGTNKVFQIFTGIVCIDTDKNIWVMKLIDLMDYNNSYYTLVKENDANDGFCCAGKYDALTDAVDADLSKAEWQDIDFSGAATAAGMKHGCADENCIIPENQDDDEWKLKYNKQ